MNEEALNTSLRKFLKVVGVTSQREIESAIRAAIEDGRLKGNEALSAKVVLTIEKAGLSHTIDGTIDLESPAPYKSHINIPGTLSSAGTCHPAFRVGEVSCCE